MDTENPEDYLKLSLKLPDDWWRTLHTIDVLINWFRRYLIGLFIEVQSGNQIQQAMFSGFLLKYRGYLLWVTAGHVIDELINLLEDDIFTFRTMHWADNFSVEGAESIPMHKRDLQNVSVSFTQLDIDFGFVFLMGLDRENLLRNDKTNIMDSIGWKNLHAANPEGYYILGYPREWTKYEGRIEQNKRMLNTFEAMPACLPISRISYTPSHNQTPFWSDPDAFYGRIESFSDGSPHPLSDINGMSGGPLLSIERTESGEMRYRLVGIQRSWDQDEQIIRAEPIQRVVMHLDYILDELEAFTKDDES